MLHEEEQAGAWSSNTDGESKVGTSRTELFILTGISGSEAAFGVQSLAERKLPSTVPFTLVIA